MASKRPLPLYPGPKLKPFEFSEINNGPRIRFLGPIGSGLHSEVHKVEMNGAIYALKLFKFYYWRMLTPPEPLQYDGVTIKDVMGQSDPFNCECRAFGRLQETGNEELAIKCHGYVILTAEEEKQLRQLSSFPWTRHRPEHQRMGIRGIVKKYVDGSAHFERSKLPQMRRDLLNLHRIGICVFDLREDNYMESKIVDFSQAHVTPHRYLDLIHQKSSTHEACWRDFIAFDGIVVSWNEAHPRQAYLRFFLPRMKYISRLRPSTRATTTPFMTVPDKYLMAPRYDWKAASAARKSASRKVQRLQAQPEKQDL